MNLQPPPLRHHRHRPVLLLAATTLLLLTTATCTPSTQAPSTPGPVHVVATTNIVADIARRVAGADATVESLMGPGVDPHLYKASESDVQRLARADLILYNGLHLEGKMGDILVKMARNRPVLAVTETIPRERLREPPEFAGQYDPHVWFDVSLWSRTPGVIADELARLDPPHADGYHARADELTAELTDLDVWIGERIASLPPDRRLLITAHDAFGYFGIRYGMDVVGIQGISTLAEAGLQDVQRVVDLVVERRVPAVFIESSVSPRTIEAVQAAVRSRGHEVAIGGQLYSDSLGAADSEAGDFAGMVRFNVNTMVEALR